MRIVAGRHRGRSLKTPDDLAVRPTADRTREALFNILMGGRLSAEGNRRLPEARVLDAFAGTGALGLEALSRGAAQAVFMENYAPAIEICRANIRRSEEHTSELQSLMRTSYAVFCLKKKKPSINKQQHNTTVIKNIL